MTEITLAECKQLCLQTFNCTHFNWVNGVCHIKSGQISENKAIKLKDSPDSFCGFRKNRPNNTTTPDSDGAFVFGLEALFPHLFKEMSNYMKITINCILMTGISILVIVFGFVLYSCLKRYIRRETSNNNNSNKVNPMPSAPLRCENTIAGSIYN